MCASVYSSLLLFLFTTTMYGTKMATEGLPLYRQEHGADKGILAGRDFLSVFIGSSLRQAYRETTNPPITTTEITTTSWQEDNNNSYIRNTRSTSYLTSPIAQSSTENQNNFYPTTISAQLSDELITKQSGDSNLNKGVVLGVHVSSSIGRTLINKDEHEKGNTIEDTTIRESVTETTTNQPTEFPDQTLIASEEHPSIVAESNKSEFSVEESEPITTNSDLMSAEFSSSYPASVQPLSRTDNRPFHSSSDYVAHELSRDNSKPFHQTVIFHNNPREPGRARSVSYSTVIQAVPNTNTEKTWEGEKLVQHERRERHYDGTQTSFGNNFDNNENKEKINDTKPFQSNDNKNYFVPNDETAKDWGKIQEDYMRDSTTRRNVITSERNWEHVEKPYRPPKLPTVYGQPEQNYEVDESASVMTNGRVHGIQPSRPTLPAKQEIKIGESKKTDDNQKVGYVVEGRNYRKYRVEERTSDGFIVGEYGVVSHDDGSLRGVRYTADGTINPRLIYDALMKFLSL